MPQNATNALLKVDKDGCPLAVFDSILDFKKTEGVMKKKRMYFTKS